jgi:hypothetical protein
MGLKNLDQSGVGAGKKKESGKRTNGFSKYLSMFIG